MGLKKIPHAVKEAQKAQKELLAQHKETLEQAKSYLSSANQLLRNKDNRIAKYDSARILCAKTMNLTCLIELREAKELYNKALSLMTECNAVKNFMS